MAEIKGVGGDVASCRGLPGNGSNKERGEAITVYRDLREATMYEGR